MYVLLENTHVGSLMIEIINQKTILLQENKFLDRFATLHQSFAGRKSAAAAEKRTTEKRTSRLVNRHKKQNTCTLGGNKTKVIRFIAGNNLIYSSMINFLCPLIS